ESGCKLLMRHARFSPQLGEKPREFKVALGALNQRVPGSSPGAPTIDPAMLFALLHQDIAEQFETRFEKSVASVFSLPPFGLGDGGVAERGIAGEIVRIED